jgi:O-antigen ligase
LKVGVGGVAVLAVARPADALLVVAGLVPLSHALITRVWRAYPFALAEALVLAFLAGYLWRQRRGVSEASPIDSLVVPSRLFALVVLASCLVQLPVLQVWHEYPLRYAASFFNFLATEYLTAASDPRPWVDGRGFVGTAALLLEGVALLLCSRTLCRQQPTLARRLTNVIVAAGVGVAILSFYNIVAYALSSHQPISVVVESDRWASPAIPSINTAGPYFMLVAFIAIGTGAASRAHLLLGLLAGVISVGAMWLTETRSAIVAGLATAVAGVVWWAGARLRWLSPRRAVPIAALIAFVVGVGVVVYNPFHILAAGGNRSLHLRVLFAETALRMMATEPTFGVGVGQYLLGYREFASPELVGGSYDPHNYFLWVGAELGLIGLGFFLWLLVAALAGAREQLRLRRSDYWFLGTCAGLFAFIITWSIGQPLAVPQVAYTFWIVLGLASASPTGAARGAAGGHRRPLLIRIALAATILFVIGSVPVRALRAISDIDLSRVSYGFSDWRTSDDGVRSRWAGPRVTFFMRSSARAIDVPLAAKLPATPHGAQVDILVNGHTADRIVLNNQDWRVVRINAPASRRRFWRVDMHVAPIGIPLDTPETQRRVAVGKISVGVQQKDPGKP